MALKQEKQRCCHIFSIISHSLSVLLLITFFLTWKNLHLCNINIFNNHSSCVTALKLLVKLWMLWFTERQNNNWKKKHTNKTNQQNWIMNRSCLHNRTHALTDRVISTTSKTCINWAVREVKGHGSHDHAHTYQQSYDLCWNAGESKDWES